MKNYKNNSKLAVIAVLTLMFLGSIGLLYSYYYSEDFTVGSTGWDLMYQYGRAGVTRNGTTTTMTVNTGGTGTLEIRGKANNNDWDYLGLWSGRMALYNGASYNASVTNPFGVVFRRTHARIDPHDDNSNPESHRHISAQSFWLFSAASLINDGTDPIGTAYEKSIVMYDMMRMVFNQDGSDEPFSTWGYYQGSEQKFDLTATIRPTGATTNIINDPTYTLEWNYDDYWTEITTNWGGVVNSSADNDNPVLIKMTHDGSTVRFYINPDPDDANPYPNEFLLVGQTGVTWSDDIYFMTGMESKRADTETQDADIDSVLVRSVASSLTAEISPAKINKGSTNDYEIVVAPTFSADDSGIGELTIKKPAAYDAYAWTPNAVTVYSFKGTGTAHATLTTLKKMTTIDTVSTANDNDVYILQDGDGNLKIRFRQTDDANNGVIDSSTGSIDADRQIVVKFSLGSLSTADGTGEAFEVYANLEKYNNNNFSKYSTTGRIQAVAGDADTAFADDTLTVKRYGNPDLLMTLNPAPPSVIYIGANRTVYMYLSATNANSPDISEVRIQVPDGFVPSYADSTRFSSLNIADDDTHVFATNDGGTNFIYVRYEADGGALPSPGGVDRITMQFEQTPSGFSGAETNSAWSAKAYSSISGTVATSARTNALYPNDIVTVRLLPPDFTGVVQTSLIINSTNYLYNHIGENEITYTIKNNGASGNVLKKVRIYFPATVTNVLYVDSSLMSSADDNDSTDYNGAGNYLELDYNSAGISLDSGVSDSISFKIRDGVTPMSAAVSYNFTTEADNGNGDGFVAGSEGVGSWAISWVSPPADGNANIVVQNSISADNTNNIYTSGTTTSVKLSLNNSGGLDNNIKMARITIPAVFTNSDFTVTSSTIIDDAAYITTSGNVVTLDYTSSANGYLENAASDTISFTVVDNVGLSANSVETFVVEVANSLSAGDLQPTGDLGLGNKMVNFVYPPVTATATITPLDINTSIDTNLITCVIVNNGDSENSLGAVKIYIPDSMASNIMDAHSTHTGFSYVPNTTGAVNFVSVVYAGTPLEGGQSDTITFTMDDDISYKTNMSVVVEASNINNSFVELLKADSSTNSILFQIPPAKASARIQPEIIFTQPDGAVTNILVITISNEGTLGNEITNVVITLPSIFDSPNKLYTPTNAKSDASISFGGGSTPITLLYTNSHLMPGETDKVYLVFKNEHTTPLANLTFGVIVDNGEGMQSASLISGGSLTGDIVGRPTASFKHDDVSNPQQIYTTVGSSDFIYTLKNGAVGGRSIKQILIDIPAPFTTTSLVVTSGWPGATWSETNGNQILLDYSANDFDAGSTETISITASDSLVEGTTNVNWTSKVDYGDGYGFRDTVVASGEFINIAFVFPDAEAYAGISPGAINNTETSMSYTVDITNFGVTGNNILLAVIELPAVITNVTALSSTINESSSIIFSNDNKIYINYETEGNSIASSGSDQISFTGFDNVEIVTNYDIIVKVANSTNTDKDYCKLASPQATGGLTLNYFRPDFGAVAYIVPVDSVSGSLPQSVLSTVADNALAFTIVNTGAPGNDLQKLEIEIPLGVFDVNSITNSISSTRLGNLTGDSRISLSNNILTIEYKTNVSQHLSANESDTISFTMADSVTSTEVDTYWKSVSYFTTSGDTPSTNGVATGQTNLISLIMPDPVSMARVLQNSVYTTTTNFSLIMDITNTGTGTDDITEIKITVPTGLQAGLSSAVMTDIVTNSFADTISYSSGEIILSYSSFTVNKNDRLYINFANGYSAVNSLSFPIVADNGVKTATTTEWTPNALKLSVVTPPSSYMVTPAWTGNLVESTRYNDTYRVYLRNDGTGTDELSRAKIIFPEGFVFISSNSFKSGTVTINSNIVTIDYSTPIGASEYDELEFDAVAPFFSGVSNVSIEVITGDVDPSSLNGGYSATRLYTGKSWTANYSHPAVEASFYLDDYTASVKPSIIVAPRDGIAMTNLSVEIANTGDYSNSIYSVQLDIPGVFSVISNYSSTSGGVINLTGNSLTINYSGSGLKTGNSDIVSFDLYYALADSTNNLLFSLAADNSDGNGLVASSVTADQFNTLDVKYPPIAIFAGVYDVDSIYTITTNTSFTYKVKNRAQGYEIFHTVITNVNWTLFDSFVVTSATGNVITNATGFEVYYTNGSAGLQFNDVDNITVNLYYDITNNNVTTLTMKNIAYLTNKNLSMSTNVNSLALVAIDTATDYANNQYLTVGPAPFGNIYGYISPHFKVDNDNNSELLPNVVKVEILKLAEDTVVATPYNQEVGLDGTLVDKPLQGYSAPDNDGYYSLDYIPAGDYRLRLTAGGFRKMITNFTVSSNMISSLPNLALENSFLDADGGNSQLVVDYNDTNTTFILPKGGILDQFSLDIGVVAMTMTQKGNVVANSLVKPPSTTVGMGCFKFTIRDSADIELSGIGIGGDGILNFHYSTTNLNLPILANWSEDDLSLYYWKETTEEWVPIGGLLNTTSDIISAKISYLHRYYAVLSKSVATATAGEIYNVKASPNPFTPGRGSENFNKVKLTFSFKNPHASYEVKIYDLKGRMVKQFKNDGSYAQGEVFWDGKDANSFGLPGGVYLYQIKAGGELFTGTVLMLK